MIFAKLRNEAQAVGGAVAARRRCDKLRLEDGGRWMRLACLVTVAASACVDSRVRSSTADRSRSVPQTVVVDARYALELAAAVARGTWADWEPGSVPFVIVYPDEQWLFRSGGPLPGCVDQPLSSSLGPVYRAPSWTRYDGVRIAFTPPWFFAQTDRLDQSLTFTTAAPSVAPFPISDWATVFVHEYFHTFQMTDPRWAEDLSWVAQG